MFLGCATYGNSRLIVNNWYLPQRLMIISASPSREVFCHTRRIKYLHLRVTSLTAVNEPLLNAFKVGCRLLVVKHASQ